MIIPLVILLIWAAGFCFFMMGEFTFREPVRYGRLIYSSLWPLLVLFFIYGIVTGRVRVSRRRKDNG